MKNNTYIHLLICVLLIFSIANHSFAQNIKEVKIGTQIWMAENLNVDRFRNGDLIPRSLTLDEFKQAIDNEKPAWCYYNNDSTYGAKYGRLYNWWAINDPRGIAPEGWKVPSYEDFKILIAYLGGKKNAGQKLKMVNAWNRPNAKKKILVDNSSGFSALPAGIWTTSMKSFSGDTMYSHWWSSTSLNIKKGFSMYLNFFNNKVFILQNCKCNLVSVRCIKIDEK